MCFHLGFCQLILGEPAKDLLSSLLSPFSSALLPPLIPYLKDSWCFYAEGMPIRYLHTLTGEGHEYMWEGLVSEGAWPFFGFLVWLNNCVNTDTLLEL